MRIHRIRIANFRGVDAAEVAFDPTGVTVIEGPNEVGKTSLAEAFTLVIEELDSSSKAALKAVKPVHRDESPEVEVELSTGPYRFVIQKRWFKGKNTTLEVLAPVREQHVGREAHDRMHAIIDETADRDLWAALRLDQGQSLGQAVLGTRSLQAALDAAAGGAGVADLAGGAHHAGEDEHTPGDAPGSTPDTTPEESAEGSAGHLWQRIEDEWKLYFTNTGQPRGDRKGLSTAIEHAQSEVSRLEAELSALENKSATVALHSARLDELAIEHDRAVVTQAEFTAEWEGLQGAISEAKALVLTRDNALLACERPRQAVLDRQAAVAEVARLASIAKELAAAHERQAPVAAEHERRDVELADAVAAARASWDAARVLHDQREGEAHYAHEVLDHQLLVERFGHVAEGTTLLLDAEKVLSSSRINAELLAAMEAAQTQMMVAEAVVQAGAGSVHVEALGALTVDIDGVAVSLASGESHDRPITDASIITIPGVARVVIAPGPGARDGADKLASARAEVARLLAAAGVPDIDSARTAASEHAAAEMARSRADELLRVHLRDLTPELMETKIDGLASSIAAYQAQHPGAHEIPSEVDEADRVLADTAKVVAAARTKLDSAIEAHSTFGAGNGARIADAAERQARLSVASDAARHAHDALDEARRLTPDPSLSAAVTEAEAVLAAAQAQVDATAEALAAKDPASVEAKLLNARALVQRLTKDQVDLDRERAELLAELRAKGEEGLQQQLDEARTAHSEAARRFARDAARAAAADLLYRTMQERREAAHRRYVAPFRERIEQLGRIVYGPTFEVVLDNELRVAQRSLHGVTLPVAQLSTGAQEQLAILARLACAATVSDDGGAPVIFDDAMGWTSPDRLAPMGAAIATAGRNCQVIILTCTPGRYAAVGTATTVRLNRAISSNPG